MQQNLFPGLEGRQLEQVQPGSGVDLGNGRRLYQAQALGHRQYVTAIDHHFLGHAATGQQGTHPVAHLPGRARPDFADHACAFEPEEFTGTRRRRVQARALQQVGAIEPRRGDADAHLAYVTGRARRLNPLHMSVNALQCFHGASIVNSRLSPEL
ncbi:hypothetical protein D3C71_1652000 [compost metagenome]